MIAHKRMAMILAMGLLLHRGIGADESAILDFSKSATVTGGWIVRALPGGEACRTLIDEVRGIPRAMSLEIDFASLPAGSSGVAILPESAFPDGSGILLNVGAIRSLTLVAELEGVDALLGVALRSEDGRDTLYEFRLRREDGEGLRTLVQENPLYVDEVRRRETEIDALYPPRQYSLAFAGFTVRLDAPAPGVRILLRLKEVRLSYDKAILQRERILP